MDDSTPSSRPDCDMDNDTAELWFWIPLVAASVFMFTVLLCAISQSQTSGEKNMAIDPGTVVPDEFRYHVSMNVNVTFELFAPTKENACEQAEEMTLPLLVLLAEDAENTDIEVERVDGGER